MNTTSASRWSDAEVDDLVRVNVELTELNRQLGAAQAQLVQAEKTASIGQLAASVAREIDTPIGFHDSNLGTLDRYLQDHFKVLAAYEACEPKMGDAQARQSLALLRREVELDHLNEDIPTLMSQTQYGIERVRKVGQDPEDSSHVDANCDWERADLHKGIDSTLNLVNREIKYEAEVVRQYGELPLVRSLASELNQVFMTLLVNAAHAITRDRGTIVVRIASGDDEVGVEVDDDGCGIAPESLQRIFDPCFTIRPVDKGTDLAQSLAHGIVKKHGGHIDDLTSEPGRGTWFRLTLPIKRTQAAT